MERAERAWEHAPQHIVNISLSREGASSFDRHLTCRESPSG